MSRRTAILIGNGRFGADSALSDLLGPKNDVRRFGEVLGNPGLGGFDVESFVDRESHVLQHILEERLNQAGRDDLVLLYYSGHGKLDSKGQLCLAAANTTLGALRSTSLSLPFVKGLVDDCRSDRIILVLDCCYSGAASKAFAVRSTVDDQLVATQQQGSGLYILTSSTAVETSREREQEQGGVVFGTFTQHLVHAIESGDADVRQTAETTLADLQAYLEHKVRGQSPRHWAFDTHGQIVISRNPRVQAARLPADILSAINHPLPSVKAGIVGDLEALLIGSNIGHALAAFDALTELAKNDSKRVSDAAARVLSERPHPTASTESIKSPPKAVVIETPSAPTSNVAVIKPAISIIELPPRDTIAEANSIDVSDVIDSRPSMPYQSLLVLMTTLALVAQGMSNQLWNFAMGIQQRQLGLSATSVSSIRWVTSVAMLIGYSAGGLLGDRLGRRRILVCSVGLFGVLTAVTVFLNNVVGFAVCGALGGLAFGASVPNAVALSCEFVPRRRQALAVTLTVMGLMIGGFVSSILQGAQSGEWPLSLLIGGVISVAIAVFLFTKIPESPRYLASHSVGRPEIVKFLLRLGYQTTDDIVLLARKNQPPMWLFQAGIRGRTILSSLAFFMTLLAANIMIAANGPVFRDSAFNPTEVAVAFGYANGIAFVCAMPASVFLDRVGAHRVMPWLIACGAAGAVIAAFLDPQSYSLLIAVAGTFALLTTVRTTLFATVAQDVDIELRARSIGLAAACGVIGSLMAGTVSIATLSNYGVRGVYLLVATIMILLLVVVIALTRRHRPEQTNSRES